MNLSTDAIKENEIMKNPKNGVAAMFIVGTVACVTIAVVAMISHQAAVATIGAGGLALTVGATANSGSQPGGSQPGGSQKPKS